VRNASFFILIAFALPIFITAGLAEAENPKSNYNLFNQTPPDLLRELNTDRPDKTESPYTVDSGYFQVEMDIINYTLDRSSKIRKATTQIAPINFKVGLTNDSDLQFIYNSYTEVREHSRATGEKKNSSGNGDLVGRLKYNFWGNDGGKSAFGVMPFVKFPVQSNSFGDDSYEGGLILPFAFALSQRMDLGAMSEVDILRDEDNRGNHAGFINSVTVGYNTAQAVRAYCEFFTFVSEGQSSDWQGSADFGVTYALTKDIQLDTGINVGVTSSADDLNPFVGASWRFG
jgi:hypothetical protein